MRKSLLILSVLIAGSLSASASQIISYNSSGYVSANTNNQELFGGQVTWSMTSPRSPASSYTGPVFFGGASDASSWAQWRIMDNVSYDYINFQDTSVANGGLGYVTIMFTNTAANLTGIVMRVSAYDSAGTTNWFRYVARDAGGSFYISGSNYFTTAVTYNQDVGQLTWYSYNPASDLSDTSLGSSGSWMPTNVTAVGVFVASRVDDASGSLGANLYIFEAYDGQSSSGPYTLTIAPNNTLWGNVSPTGGVYASGSNVQISATASNHYHFSNWSGAISSTNSTTNVVMSANRSVTANFAADTHTITVNSERGTPAPAGVTTNNYGSILTNTVDSPVTSGFTQYVCTGWTLTGNSPVTGTTNTCVLTLTNNATLTWNWQTNISTTPSMARGPASLAFTHYIESNAPPAQSFYVTNIGAGLLHVSNSWNAAWLSVSPAQTNGLGNGQSATFSVSILSSGLSVGVSNAVITINSTNADNGPLTVSVQLTVLSTQTFGTASTDWPTYGGNSNRTFRSSQSMTFPLEKSWVRKFQDPIAAHNSISKESFQSSALFYPVEYDQAPSTIVVSNRAYVSLSTEEAVLCMDANTGSNIWSFCAEGAVRLVPTYDNGKIYFGADDGYAYCLNANDGSLVWKVYATTNAPRRSLINEHVSSIWPVRTGVAVDNGKAYFAGGVLPSQGSYVSCVNADNGSIIWRTNVRYAVQGYILVSGNNLYIGTGRTAPMQYNKLTGTPAVAPSTANIRREGGGINLSTLNSDWMVSGPSENGIMQIRISTNNISAYAANAANYRFPGEMVPIKARRILMDNDRVYFLHLYEKFTTARIVSNALIAVPVSSVTGIFWNCANNFDSRYPRSTVDVTAVYWHQGYAKIGAESSEPQTMIALTNAESWSVKNNPPLNTGLLAANALFTGGSNVVAAYSLSNGANLWSAAVTGMVYELSLANGALYAGTDAGYVYCFSNGASGSVNESAPTYSSPYPTNDSLAGVYTEAAQLALTNAGVSKGYCLVLGAGEGRLAYEIAKRSGLYVIGLEVDPAKAAAARANLMQAGVYGSRVAIHQDINELFPHPDYFANLIVSEELLINGSMPYSSREIFRMLHPYTGTVLFGNKDGNLDISSWAAADMAMSSFSDVASAQGVTWKIARRGELSGFGTWNHQLASPGNTLCSEDERVKNVLALQWINELNPQYALDRHAEPGSPVVDRGRLFYAGLDHVTAIDAYNGEMIWDKPLGKTLRQMTQLDAPMMCSVNDRLYVASSNTCRIFDAQTGSDVYAYQGPLSAYDWGYVAVYSNILFGSNQKTGASIRAGGDVTYIYLQQNSGGGCWPVVSANLFAKNPTNGTVLWNYANGVVLNSSIAIGGTNIFFAVSRNSTAMNDVDGRVALSDFFASDAWLVSLDMNSGATAWELPLPRWAGGLNESAFFNSYAGGRLISAGTHWGDATANNAIYTIILRDAVNGTTVGSTNVITGGDGGAMQTDHNGVLMRPFITKSKAYLRTYTATSVNTYTLTNGAAGIFTFSTATGTKGCTPPSASADTIYYRGYSIEGTSLTNGAAKDITTITRPSCWPSIIPAGGVLLMPEGSSGCDCGMAEQLSMAMAPYYTDTQAPSLFNVVATNATTVIVVFTEAVSPATAENKANYAITQGTNVITVSAAARQTNHLDRVTLTVSTLPGGTNTLAVSGVKDLYNNAMSSQQMNFLYGAADTDSDGLPDWWEQQYFSNPTNAVPSVDSDQDGLSNWQEYIAGTDPMNVFSTLRVENIIPAAGSSYVVTWTPQSNRTYNVLWTDKLTTNFIAQVTGLAYPQARWTDTLHGASADGFYRIEAVK